MSQFNHRTLVSTALRCATGLLLLSGIAAAQSKTYTSSALIGPTSQADSIALPSFNTDLGTLESVVVTLQLNICPTTVITNSTSAPLQYSGVGITAPFNISGPGGLTYNNTLSTSTNAGTAAPGNTSLVDYKTGWIYAVLGAKTNSLGFWEDQPGDLVDLVITPGEISTSAGATLPAGLTVANSALEWENISVKYNYLSTAAVPEPSGKFLALIVGTAMAGFMVRRRMRVAA